MKTIEQAAQECAERIDSKVRMFTAHTGALEDFTPLIAAAMRDVLAQSEKASAFVNVAVRASEAEEKVKLLRAALDVAEETFEPLLSMRPDGDIGWRGNRRAKCGWLLVGHILAIERALAHIAEARK